MEFFDKGTTKFERVFYSSICLLFVIFGFAIFNSDWTYKNVCSKSTGWFFNESNPLEIEFDTNDLFFNVHCNEMLKYEPPILKNPLLMEGEILKNNIVFEESTPKKVELEKEDFKRAFAELWFFIYRFIALLGFLYLAFFFLSIVTISPIVSRIKDAVKWALIIFCLAVVCSIYIKFVIGWY